MCLSGSLLLVASEVDSHLHQRRPPIRIRRQPSVHPGPLFAMTQRSNAFVHPRPFDKQRTPTRSAAVASPMAAVRDLPLPAHSAGALGEDAEWRKSLLSSTSGSSTL